MSITGPSSEVVEGSDAVFTVTLDNLADEVVTVRWSALPHRQMDNAEFSDYGNGEGTGSFTIPANTRSQTFAVPINDDNLAEPAEGLVITLGVISAPGFRSDAIASSNRQQAQAIIAASDPITVSLSDPATVEEGSETADYTVSLSGGTPIVNVAVDYATADDTAEAGSDYTATSGTLTFTPADHADKTFTVQTTDDTVKEGAEAFTVTLSNAVGGGQTIVLGTSSSTTEITEGAGATLSVSASSLAEDASATDITVTATLDGDTPLTSDVTFSITLGGTAGSGDYSASSLSSITITAGESSGSGTLTITPTDDAIVEGDETITVSGSTSGIDTSPVDITITDNDTATVSISGPSEVVEASTHNYYVTLSAPIAGEISVAYEVRADSATAGNVDYSYYWHSWQQAAS